MEMQVNNLFVFVYGTLRRECKTGANRKYLHDAMFISPAKIRGVLYLIDYYPGLCLDTVKTKEDDKHQSGWVTGEIFLLKDTAQLNRLDEYEGCSSTFSQPREYVRMQVNVTLPQQQTRSVWTYIYIGDTSDLPLIASGDFLQD